MPSKGIAPAPYQTFQDLNGATIINGTVTVRVTGTSTLAVVYADADGLVVSPNPLTVDAAGRWVLFLTPGEVYDFEFRDGNGALVKTVPEVQATGLAGSNVDVLGVAAETIQAGQAVGLNDNVSFISPGQWSLAGANLPQTKVTVGVAVTAATAGQLVTVRTAGSIPNLSGLTVGSLYYVGATPGSLSVTVPPPPGYRRLVGQADTVTSLVLWPNPPDVSAAVTSINAGGVLAQLDPQGAATVLLGNNALLTVQGIKAGVHGQRLRLIATVAQVDFVHYSPSALVVDRLWNWATSAPTSLNPENGSGPYAVIDYLYVGGGGGWRIMAHEQGGWITPTFSAADYSGTASLTWTVAAGNVGRCAYRLSGLTLDVQLSISGSTLGGVTNPQLKRVLPGGYQTLSGGITTVLASDAGGSKAGPYVNCSGANMFIFAGLAVNWALGAGMQVYVDTTVEVF